MKLTFKNWIENVQTLAYYGAHKLCLIFSRVSTKKIRVQTTKSLYRNFELVPFLISYAYIFSQWKCSDICNF